MSNTPKEKAAKQPLINQKMTLRFAVGLFAIAGLIYAWQWFQSRASDWEDLGRTDTKGFIAALQVQPGGGSKVVAIKPNGEVWSSPDYTDEARDREIVWKPDGNQIFFTSDRPTGKTNIRAYNLFRWNLAKGVNARTQGKVAWSRPSFFNSTDPQNLKEILVLSGGSVWVKNISDFTGERVMPFVRESAENANLNQDPDSGDLNFRAKVAKWGPDKQLLYAVRRVEAGEILVVQPMGGDPEKRTPIPIVAGDQIQFDVHPETGEVYYIVHGLQWLDPQRIPERFREGKSKFVKPFLNYIGYFDPAMNETLGFRGIKDLLPNMKSEKMTRSELEQDLLRVGIAPEEIKYGRTRVVLDDMDQEAGAEAASKTYSREEFGNKMAASLEPMILAALPTNSNKDYGSIAISPDGSLLLITRGTNSADGGLVPEELLSMRTTVYGGAKAPSVLKGEIYEPSWHPTGQQIVYIKREAGVRNIYTAEARGSNEKRVSDGKASYMTPLFSPQSR